MYKDIIVGIPCISIDRKKDRERYENVKPKKKMEKGQKRGQNYQNFYPHFPRVRMKHTVDKQYLHFLPDTNPFEAKGNQLEYFFPKEKKEL